MADSVNVYCLPNANAADDLTHQLSSLSAIMSDWMADSGNVTCFTNADNAEDRMPLSSSLRAVMRDWIADTEIVELAQY